jgi:aryl-alcohol dehydrogenase-like predicted oxidoreductase
VSEPRRPDVSRVVLGCGNFGGVGSAPAFFGKGTNEAEAFALMDAAWELGLRWFDTADAYGGGRSETYIGSWIRSTGHRPHVTTKTFNPMAEGADHGLARDRVLRQIEASLERLSVDSVELYLMHEVPDVQIDEAVDTFEEVVASGRAHVYALFPVLADRTKQLAGTLSGGEQQMVAMGRALMARPKLLLMDEPSMGLAPILVERSFEIIEQVHEAGVAVLVVEQNANVSLSIADRGYVLSTGRIVLEGKASDLLRHDELRKAYLGR